MESTPEQPAEQESADTQVDPTSPDEPTNPNVGANDEEASPNTPDTGTDSTEESSGEAA